MKSQWAHILLLGIALPAWAEMEGDAYVPDGVLDTRSRESVRARIQAEQAAEAERERLRQAEWRAEQARIAAEAARRPYPERLFEARCGLCHAPEQLAPYRHTWLGWQAVIARMRWLNGAPLSLSEGNVLARHLAERQGARGFAAALEWLLLAAAILALVLAPWLGWRWLRRHQ